MPHPAHFIHHYNDGDSLFAAWLPEEPRRLLIGVKSWSQGASRIIDAGSAEQLAAALAARAHLLLEEKGDTPSIQVTKANRGEPYRDGMRIEAGDHSIFLEEGYDLDEFIELLRRT